VALSDDELLDFDVERMPMYEPAKAERALAKHGDAYRYQLVAARQIEAWAEKVEEVESSNPDWTEGHAAALREIAAHLRQGDYLPCGVTRRSGVSLIGGTTPLEYGPTVGS
jgi:hypothetical protein